MHTADGQPAVPDLARVRGSGICAQVPAVLLVCRNSTDTAYFQRLRPYPRVMLRRSNCAFKDYDKTPIGFGVAVFCIAKAPCKCGPLFLTAFVFLHPIGSLSLP